MDADHPLASRPALAQRALHRRQLGLVRESLVLRPPVGRPTHRRWA